MEKYSKEMDMNKSWGSNTYIKQNRLHNEAIKRDKEDHYIILINCKHFVVKAEER